jgi:hypothetical protein
LPQVGALPGLEEPEHLRPVGQVGVSVAFLQLAQLFGVFFDHPWIVYVRHGYIVPLMRRISIRGFSRVSRRNLLRKFASINRTAFRAYKGRVFSVTLTYPHVYPEDPNVCKRHLKAFYKRLKRRFGEFAGFWRMGIQKRGAWHFHLLLFMPSSPRLSANLRYFVSSSWYEVCREVSEGHLFAGTRVDEIRTWRRVTSYAERYMAKEEEFPEGLETGRIWGGVERDSTPRPVGDGKGHTRGRLQN